MIDFWVCIGVVLVLKVGVLGWEGGSGWCLRDYGDWKIMGVLMVGRREYRNGFVMFYVLLLGDDYIDDVKENCGLYYDEVVVLVCVDEGFDCLVLVMGRRLFLGD